MSGTNEGSGLLGRQQLTSTESQLNVVGERWSVILLLGFAFVGAAQFWRYGRYSGDFLLNSFSLHREVLKPSLTWTLYNPDYDPIPMFVDKSTIMRYKILNNFDAIIEPGIAMHIYLSQSHYKALSITACPTISSSSCSCVSSTQSGTKAFILQHCTPHEDFDLTIIIEDVTSGSQSYLNGTAKCMYVRREIRSLTDDDLSSTMDAMAQIWTTGTSEGQKLYGDDFHNIAYFTSAHYFGSASLIADWTHAGQGFLPQHSKLSSDFELAIQAVNSRISLPYWDYTIDS